MPEGKYNVVGEISDPFAQRREAPGIQVRAGETVQVKMNFDPAGLLRVRVMADGKPLEARAWVHFFGGEGGKWTQMDQVSRGVLELKVPEGVHDVEIDPELEGIENKWLRGVEIAGGTTVEKTVDIGGSSLLRLRVVADGKPLEARAWVHFFGGEGGKWTQMDQVSRGVLELKVPAGVHDIEISPDLEGIQTQWLRGVEITGGATVEKTIDIGGSGLLRLRVIADGKPIQARAWVHFFGGEGGNYTGMDQVSRGVLELKVPAGVHDIEISPDLEGIQTQWLRGVEITGGATVEKTIDIGGSGLLRLRVIADGKPIQARAWVHFFGGEGGNYTGMDQVSRGVLELKVPAGVHDIEISPDLEGIQTQWLRGVEITGGATVEKTVTIGALGLLRVRLIADGKPLNKASIEVYDDYDDYVMDLTRVAGGTFEARLPGGMYRIVIEPDDSDSYDVEFIDGIELDDGQTVELNVTLREF
ncbi:MAG: hypothetical protein BWY92_01465 [Firmicutes bacterium ADurb.BinA052]|nr:MAG: hypothetical protein BWY92_01465 [Firmicutes bacterium ADurb.BinA052]